MGKSESVLSPGRDIESGERCPFQSSLRDLLHKMVACRPSSELLGYYQMPLRGRKEKLILMSY